MILGFIFCISVSFILPYVLAKTRKTYITDFILDNNQTDGFTNSLDGNDISYKATANALEMLDFFELYEEPQFFDEAKVNVNMSVFQSNIKDELADYVSKEGIPDIYALFHLLRAIDLLNTSISSNLKDNIKTYISDAEQASGGYGPTNTSTSANLISTYYSINVLKSLNIDIENTEQHTNFILLTENSDGGFGGNESLDSTLANTYYALKVLQELESLDEISDSGNTIEYIKQYYINDKADKLNYGGFLPDDDSNYCLLSSTFYAIKSIALLDENELPDENTTEWVLDRQNFKDGGFFNYNGLDNQETSSVINTFYAFQILKTYDEELLYLNENVWMVEFNWVILIILLTVIGVAVAGGIYYWQTRRI